MISCNRKQQIVMSLFIALSELGRKDKSCNITIHEQSKPESYLAWSVTRRWPHTLWFPIATDRTSCSHDCDQKWTKAIIVTVQFQGKAFSTLYAGHLFRIGLNVMYCTHGLPDLWLAKADKKKKCIQLTCKIFKGEPHWRLKLAWKIVQTFFFISLLYLVQSI